MLIIKYRGYDINDNPVDGLLTKKKIRNSGKISWAIATGNCSLAETVPITADFAPIVGQIGDRLICDGDTVGLTDFGAPYSAELSVVFTDIFGKSYFPPKDFISFINHV